jgi:hypothetical protein
LEYHRSTIFKNGKPSINGPFSMAILNNQRVYLAVSQRVQLDAKGGVAEAFQAEAWESEGTSLRLISWQSYRNSSVPERHLG